jgi:ATP adenylyltransferase
MKNLWSPWRSKYIESFKDEQSGGECIFCQSVEKEISDSNNLVVHKGINIFVMLNLYPYNNGHLMIVPKRHIGKLQDMTSEESKELLEQIILAEKILSEVYKPQGFNIGANLGRAGGAGIEEHIHFHIVPRWNGDTNFMPVIGEVKVISQDLAESKRKLIDAYKKLGK